MLDQQCPWHMSLLFVGRLLSDTPLREHTVHRTQAMVLKSKLVTSSGEYCIEAALGWSGWIIFWLCGIFSKMYNCIAHWRKQEML